MKKIGFFLIMIMTILLGTKQVHAEDHMFYEGETINNIYMSKYNYSNQTIYYQQARTFRKTNSGEIAYCIEPLIFFQEGSKYTETLSPRNLSKDQLDKIKKIAYFGYQYENHSDMSWYAVAQMMIWRVASPYEGDYYFTETLNGARTTKYDWQINEINHLIEQYDNEIAIRNQTITLIEGMKAEITIGKELENYTTENEEIEIKGDKIIIKDLTAKEYNITLKRKIKSYHNGPIVIYQAQNSQNLMKLGNLEEKQVSFKINVISNYIKIKKVDADTKLGISKKGASLDGSIFYLYREGTNEKIAEVEIVDGVGLIKNIPYGRYYLKEVKAGEGYQINEKIYPVEITEEETNIELTIENKIIEKKVIIEKKYGEKDNLFPEEGIEFEVYNEENELVLSVKTDQYGRAEFTLPYGKYTLVQKNTTEGYQKIEPLDLTIKDQEEIVLELKDYKVEVPNTHTEKRNFLLILLLWIMRYLC